MDAIKEFIRKNLFLTVLVASVLVIDGAAVIGWRMPSTADSNKRVAVFEKESKSQFQLRSEGRSQAEVDAVKAERGALKIAWDDLAQRAGTMNRVSRLLLKIEGVPLFPVDEAAYTAHTIRLRFAQLYADEMDKLLADLDPTDPPTPAEVAINTDRMISRRTQELQLAHMPDQEALVLPPGVNPPRDPEADADDPDSGLVLSGTRVSPARGVAVVPEVMVDIPQVDVDKMRRRAEEDLKARKAREGKFFANAFSMEPYPLPKDVKPRLEQMWKAYITLLLHQHITETILRTNRGVLPEDPKRNIGNAAVKRLVRVAFPEMAQGDESLYAGEKTPTKGYPGASARRADDSTNVPRTLTQHTCTKLYDVVPFSFTVVMDPTELDRFLREVRGVEPNADKRDRAAFFTILGVSLSEPGTGPMGRVSGYSGDRRGGGVAAVTPGTRPSEEMFYYGPRPVVQVTVKVEAQFLTSWSRDLMPKEMLERLPASALREADRDRIGQSGASVAG